MTRPAEFNRYPPQFMLLAERFEQNPQQSIVIPLDDGIKPKAFQIELSSFRTALKKHNLEFPAFISAEISAGGDGKSVIIAAKNKTRNALAVQRALDALDKGEDQ